MEFEEILATCIERLEMGETIESCLALFPDEAAELAPLLEMAVEVRSMDAPMLSDAGFKKGRHAVAEAAAINKEYSLVSAPPDTAVVLLDETGAHIPGPRQNGGSGRTVAQKRRFAWPTFAGTAVAAALLIAVLAGLSQAQQILPGSALYTVKQLGEQGQGALMTALGSEVQWYATLAERRLNELQALQASGEPTTAEQMDRLLSEIDQAIAASESLGPDERAKMRADLYASLTEAKETLTISGPALALLEKTQSGLAPTARESAVAVAPTPVPDETDEEETDEPVVAIVQPSTDEPSTDEPVNWRRCNRGSCRRRANGTGAYPGVG